MMLQTQVRRAFLRTLATAGQALHPTRHARRSFSHVTPEHKGGVVVGFYEKESGSIDIKFTPAGSLLDQFTNGHVSHSIALSGKRGKLGDSVVLFASHPDFPRIAVVGLGKEAEANKHGVGEAVRSASGSGAKILRANGARTIAVDCSHQQPLAAAEGASLGLFKFDQLKKRDKNEDSTPVKLLPFTAGDGTVDPQHQWHTGTVMAEAQNIARTLAELPANLMTPSIFVDRAKELMDSLQGKSKGSIEVAVRDSAWMRARRMGCLLGVAQGSKEEPKFLELHYKHPDASSEAPLVLVGKGVTFDSGGISIKPSSHMGMMKGDMSGAASVVAAVHALASMSAPVHVIALTPLTENMPGGGATRPGDVLVASNGTSVEVDNTDAEGRLILADALVYAQEFKPHTIVDVATLTGAIDVALGTAAMGAFTPDDALWYEMEAASKQSGERAWRMPLLPEYRKQINSKVADIINSTPTRSAGACTAATFLKEFVHMDRWIHLDIAGVMHSSEDSGYVTKGMTGRPVRTLINLALQRAE
eukprot:TRINITY_DN14906_c0_g1_i4.p1 TRINITY_DN14906_c0_g1~~TRINITY_DN14906_c0_g1_i4.p1  ORF type:complete len:532 (-),score=97.96 TRINITY_DN14906_c0_g1_i4:13-1608(-)